MKTALGILGLGLLMLFRPTALPAQEFSGREIMTLVYDRADGEDRTATITMTLVNRRGSQRVRTVQSFSKDYGPDRKSVMVFQEPADVRGTAYLAWDYEDAGREDDKWLYIPSIRKARRISGASRNEYFMGTDFTYDDMGRRAVDEDTHTLLGEETVLEHPCWKIESIPVDKDDLYTRKVFWVSQRAHLVMQGEYYDRDGLIKTYKALDVREQDGFWTLMRSEMDNVSREHKTVMESAEVRYDSGLEDSLFQVSTIERGRVR